MSDHRRLQFRLLTALFAVLLSLPPRPAAASGSVTLHSGFGNSAPEPPRAVIHPSSFTVIHAGERYVGGSESEPNAGILYYADGTLYGAPHLTALSGASTTSDWDSAAVTEVEADISADQVLVAGSTTITVSYTITAFSLSIDAIDVQPLPTSGTHSLYIVLDSQVLGRTANTFLGGLPQYEELLGGLDDSDRFVGVYEDGLLYWSGLGMKRGVTEGRPDSVMYGSVACVFGKASGCPSRGPLDGSAYSGDQEGATDGAIGMHYNLIDRAFYHLPEIPTIALPAEAPTEEPTDKPTAPAQCEQLPDIALSPERIELAAGGRTAITITMRNLCADAPFSQADLLLSLSDGLSVADLPAGWLNLGQRAALQGLALGLGETRSWTLTVAAADPLPTAPLHVLELYYRGAAAARIDGVFVPAAAAAAPEVPAAVEVPAVAEAPAAPAAPAPLPVALPNTAGPLLPLGALALSGLALAALGAIGRRLR